MTHRLRRDARRLLPGIDWRSDEVATTVALRGEADGVAYTIVADRDEHRGREAADVAVWIVARGRDVELRSHGGGGDLSAALDDARQRAAALLGKLVAAQSLIDIERATPTGEAAR